MKKKAVVLMGFGGPESLEQVPKFLQEIFSDPCIIVAPTFVRKVLSFFLARLNKKRAQESYRQIGGCSPYVTETRKQKKALEQLLGKAYKVFFAARYGNPDFSSVVKEVLQFRPDSVVFVPLFPHMSMTTTLSGFSKWESCAQGLFLEAKKQRICCYPLEQGFIEASGDLILETLRKTKNQKNTQLIFSAHGTPASFVKKGDPYTDQVKMSAEKILQYLKQKNAFFSGSTLCYQSKVGPVQWTQPFLKTVLKEMGAQKKDVLVVPITFICEHSETLVELDIEAKQEAKSFGVQNFYRVPTVSCHPKFIKALKNRIENPEKSKKICPQGKRCCFKQS